MHTSDKGGFIETDMGSLQAVLLPELPFIVAGALLALALLHITGSSLPKGTIERCIRTRESALASLERASDRLSFPLPVKRAAGKAPAQIEDSERHPKARSIRSREMDRKRERKRRRLFELSASNNKPPKDDASSSAHVASPAVCVVSEKEEEGVVVKGPSGGVGCLHLRHYYYEP
ncbi:hypothetical protein MTO96_019151 [Rhipicephalus appendiculatus]